MSESGHMQEQPGAGGKRSVKQLRVSVEAVKYQRDWFKATQKRLAAGEPFCLANADAPHEIFLTMEDIPVVMTQWWSAIISAKQMSGYYFDGMNERGFRERACAGYCSLPLACAMDHPGPSRPPGRASQSDPASSPALLRCTHENIRADGP